jgi:hypothetical protein
VRAFLGTASTMLIWIKDFSSIAKRLVDLTRKNIDFVWKDKHDHAMESLKQDIISPALIPTVCLQVHPRPSHRIMYLVQCRSLVVSTA